MTIPPVPALPASPAAPASAAPAGRDAGGDFHALVQQHLDRGREEHAHGGTTDGKDTRAAKAPGTKKPVSEASVDRDLAGAVTASMPVAVAAPSAASTPVVVPSSDAAGGQPAAAGGAAEAGTSPLGGVALAEVAAGRPAAAPVATPGVGAASGPGRAVASTPAARTGQTGQVAQAGLTASGVPAAATPVAADDAPVTAAGSATAPAATTVSRGGPVPTAPAAAQPPAPSSREQLSEPTEPGRKTQTRTPQVPVDAASPTPASAPGPAAVPPAHAQQVTGTATAATGSTQTAPTASSPVLDQVLPAVPRLVSRGDGTQRLTLKLHPADLGEVHLTVTVRGGSVDVTLAAGHEAREALRDGSSQLRSLLELTGHTTGQLVIRDLPGGGTTASTAPTAGTQPGPTGGQTGAHPGGDQPTTTFGQHGEPRQHQGGGPARADAPPRPSDTAGGAPDPDPQAHPAPRAHRGSAVALDVRI